MKNHEKALEFSEYAIGYYRELHDAVPLAECLLFQGNLHKSTEKYTTAIHSYQEAIAITEPIQSYSMLILGEKSLGETLILTQQYREAEAALAKALQHITAQNAPNVAQQINEVAALLIRLGEATNDAKLIQQYTPMISKH
jgi:tetratricopeptide (TPR) repeat protein